MCGIAAALGHPQGDAVVRRMLRAIAHRGPDDEAVYSEGNVSLGMCRLDIVGGPHGKQPYVTGDHVCVFNGEIYNFAALHHSQIRFSPHAEHSDTATFAELLQGEGYGSLCRMDGMFAAIIATPHHLVLIRDPIGIKPLYFTVCRATGAVLVCSEAKGLVSVLDRRMEIDAASLSDVAVLGFPLDNATLFEDIQAAPAGTVTIVSRATKQIVGSLPFTPATMAYSDGDVTDVLESRLRDSLRLQTSLAELPAISLSGGVDSCLLAALLAEIRGRAPRAFVAAPEGPHPDKAASAAIADAGVVRLQHVTLSMNGMLKRLAKLVWALESPFGLPAIPQLFVAEAAHRGGHRVILTGEGADELFCGYDVYQRQEPLIAALQAAFRRASMTGGVRPSLADWVDRLSGQADDDRYTALTRKLYLAEQIQFNHLAVSDRLFMAESVECRVPYLGVEVVGFANSLDVHNFIDPASGERKAVLRRLARRQGGVCAMSADRRKIGFPAAVSGLMERLKSSLRSYNAIYGHVVPILRPLSGLDALMWDLFIEIFVHRAGTPPKTALVGEMIAEGMSKTAAATVTRGPQATV